MIIENCVSDVQGLVLPTPKFQLFQSVRSHYVDENLICLDDFGIVVGVFWSPPLYQDGWWYWILWTALPSFPNLDLPHLEESFERDLRPAD